MEGKMEARKEKWKDGSSRKEGRKEGRNQSSKWNANVSFYTEYKEEEGQDISRSGNSEDEVPKNTREISKENQLEEERQSKKGLRLNS